MVWKRVDLDRGKVSDGARAANGIDFVCRQSRTEARNQDETNSDDEGKGVRARVLALSSLSP